MFSQVTGADSLDAQTCGGRGMGPTTRLQNHVREVTWVWHYGARKSLGECHVRHVGACTCRQKNEGIMFAKSRGSAEVDPVYRHVVAGTRGTEVQVLQAR